MPETPLDDHAPAYDDFRRMDQVRGPLAAKFARQIVMTTAPFLERPTNEIDVLDLGSGYGHTARELAGLCKSVTGMEPAADLYTAAAAMARSSGLDNLKFRHAGVEELVATNEFDLVVLDNVYEHLPRQTEALAAIARCLRPGGALFLLTPNKLWPIEAHYRLPFLSYLPLSLANTYLRLSRRGHDYTDASYAPTYWSLKRELMGHKGLSWQFVLPGDSSATMMGAALHYRLGMALIDRVPSMWAISKAFLVVATTRNPDE